MAIGVPAIGDTVYYPNPSVKSTRTMIVIDRYIKYWKKSGKLAFRFIYDTLLDHFVEDCHTNISNDYDNVKQCMPTAYLRGLVVSGREGSGKSTMAIQLAKKLNPDFDLEADYIYTYEELVQAVADPVKPDKGRVFLLDETSSIMSNRDAMTQSSKNMVNLLETMRSKGWTLIMCIPSVERLDKYLRDFRIRYLINCAPTVWDKLGSMPRGVFELKFKRGDSYETFYCEGYGLYDDLDEETKRIYHEIKEKSQQRLMDKLIGKDPEPKDNQHGRAQKKLGDALLMLSDYGVSHDDLAKTFGYTKHSVNQMLCEARKRRKESEEE